MTDYADVPQVQALYDEQVQINRALDILDNYGGTIPAYTVSPTTGSALIGVQITTVDPGQSLLAGVRSSLIQRYNAINKELRDLGVTGGPPDHAGGPHAETAPA